MAEPSIEKLITECRDALRFSYCPYSKFRVGAAIETSEGLIYKGLQKRAKFCGQLFLYFGGCNVENAAYSGSICAERTAIAKAVSEGHTQFKAIAITSDMIAQDIIVPCGNCRQFIREV